MSACSFYQIWTIRFNFCLCSVLAAIIIALIAISNVSIDFSVINNGAEGGHFIKLGASSIYAEGLDSKIKLLMHCDGTNGSTAFVDECGKSVISSGVAMDTATKKFGTASAKVTGNNYLYIPYNPDFNFRGDDFTVAVWIKVITPPSEYRVVGYILENGNDSLNNTSWEFSLYNANGKIVVRGDMFSNGSYSALCWKKDLNDGKCHHVAFTRSGSAAYLFVDGIKEMQSSYIGTNSLTETNCSLRIGYENVYGRGFVAYIDEVLIEKGIAL